MQLVTRLADRMVALDQGAVIAEGTPAEIVRHPRVVESYLGSIADDIQLGTPSNGRRTRAKSDKPRAPRASGGRLRAPAGKGRA